MSGYPQDPQNPYLPPPGDSPYRATRPPGQHATPPSRPAPTVENLQKYAVQEATKRGIDPALVLAQIGIESEWQPRAVSEKGAVGLAQGLPSTIRGSAPKYGMDARKVMTDPYDNIRWGVNFLGDLLDKHGDVDQALYEYHGGPDTRQWGPKTHAYAPKVQAAREEYAKRLVPMMASGQATGQGGAQPVPVHQAAPSQPTSLDSLQEAARDKLIPSPTWKPPLPASLRQVAPTPQQVPVPQQSSATPPSAVGSKPALAIAPPASMTEAPAPSPRDYPIAPQAAPAPPAAPPTGGIPYVGDETVHDLTAPLHEAAPAPPDTAEVSPSDQAQVKPPAVGLPAPSSPNQPPGWMTHKDIAPRRKEIQGNIKAIQSVGDVLKARHDEFGKEVSGLQAERAALEAQAKQVKPEAQPQFNAKVADYNKRLKEQQAKAEALNKDAAAYRDRLVSHQVDVADFNQQIGGLNKQQVTTRRPQPDTRQQYESLKPLLDKAAQAIGEFEALKAQAAAEKESNQGFWQLTLRKAYDKAQQIKQDFGKHVEVGEGQGWPYVKPLGWQMDGGPQPKSFYQDTLERQGVGAEEARHLATLSPADRLKYQSDQRRKEIEEGPITGAAMAGGEFYVPGKGIVGGSQLSPYEVKEREQYRVTTEKENQKAANRYWRAIQNRNLGEEEDAKHWAVTNAIRHGVSNVLAGGAETIYSVGGKAATPLAMLVDLVRPGTSDELDRRREEVIKAAEDAHNRNAPGTLLGDSLYEMGKLLPKAAVPGGPVGFGMAETADQLGHGKSASEAIQHGLTAFATAELGGMLGSRFSSLAKALPERGYLRSVGEYFGRATGYAAAPAAVQGMTTGKLPDRDQSIKDLVFGFVFALHGSKWHYDLDAETPPRWLDPLLKEVSQQAQQGGMTPQGAERYVSDNYRAAVQALKDTPVSRKEAKQQMGEHVAEVKGALSEASKYGIDLGAIGESRRGLSEEAAQIPEPVGSKNLGGSGLPAVDESASGPRSLGRADKPIDETASETRTLGGAEPGAMSIEERVAPPPKLPKAGGGETQVTIQMLDATGHVVSKTVPGPTSEFAVTADEIARSFGGRAEESGISYELLDEVANAAKRRGLVKEDQPSADTLKQKLQGLYQSVAARLGINEPLPESAFDKAAGLLVPEDKKHGPARLTLPDGSVHDITLIPPGGNVPGLKVLKSQGLASTEVNGQGTVIHPKGLKYSEVRQAVKDGRVTFGGEGEQGNVTQRATGQDEAEGASASERRAAPGDRAASVREGTESAGIQPEDARAEAGGIKPEPKIPTPGHMEALPGPYEVQRRGSMSVVVDTRTGQRIHEGGLGSGPAGRLADERNQQEAETRQAEGAKNAPLFGRKKSPSPKKLTPEEFYAQKFGDEYERLSAFQRESWGLQSRLNAQQAEASRQIANGDFSVGIPMSGGERLLDRNGALTKVAIDPLLEKHGFTERTLKNLSSRVVDAVDDYRRYSRGFDAQAAAMEAAQVESESPHHSNFQPRDEATKQFVEGKPLDVESPSPQSIVKAAQSRLGSGQAADDYIAQHGPGTKNTRGYDLQLSNAREVLSPETRRPEGMAEYGEHLTPQAHELLGEVYSRAIDDPKVTDVVLSLGGTGVGKTSFMEPETARRGSVSFEAHGEDADRLTAMIDEALSRGKRVTISGISRDPGESYDSVLTRFKDGPQRGKVVSLDRAADTHVTAPATFNELKRRFAGEAVDFRVIDNTGQVPQAAESMPEVGKEEAKTAMSKVLEKAHSSGRLTDDEYNQFSGRPLPASSRRSRTEGATQAAQGKGEGAEKGTQGVEGQVDKKHEFSSTQVNLPDETAAAFRSLAAKIPNAELAEEGREDQPHVTIKFGIKTDDAEAVRAVAEAHAPIKLTFGEARLFPTEAKGDTDVLRMVVHSDDLTPLRNAIKDAVEHERTYPRYVPHATIAYLKPGMGEKYTGPNELTGKTITVDRIYFSDRDRKQTEIQLKGEAHHSLKQPRDDDGQFIGPPIDYTPKAEREADEQPTPEPAVLETSAGEASPLKAGKIKVKKLETYPGQRGKPYSRYLVTMPDGRVTTQMAGSRDEAVDKAKKEFEPKATRTEADAVKDEIARRKAERAKAAESQELHPADKYTLTQNPKGEWIFEQKGTVAIWHHPFKSRTEAIRQFKKAFRGQLPEGVSETAPIEERDVIPIARPSRQSTAASDDQAAATVRSQFAADAEDWKRALEEARKGEADLAPAGKATFTWRPNRNYLAVNEAGRRALSQAYGKDVRGVTVNPKQAKKLAEKALDYITGVTAGERQNLQALAAALEEAATESQEFAILNLSLSTRPTVRHELFHVVQKALERFYSSAPDLDAVERLPHFKSLVTQLKLKGYTYFADNGRALANEAAAHIAAGQWAELGLKRLEALDFLDAYFNLLGKTYGADALAKFDRLTKDYKELRDATIEKLREEENAAGRTPGTAQGGVQSAPEGRQEGAVEAIEAGGEDAEADLRQQDWGKRFPRAGKVVDGREVRDHIPNQSSVNASLVDYDYLPGVREVFMSDMDQEYEPSTVARVRDLARRIKESGEINPLIVVVDKEGLYILEGANRYDALKMLGAKSFPAQVVIDRESIPEPSEEILAHLDPRDIPLPKTVIEGLSSATRAYLEAGGGNVAKLVDTFEEMLGEYFDDVSEYLPAIVAAEETRRQEKSVESEPEKRDNVSEKEARHEPTERLPKRVSAPAQRESTRPLSTTEEGRQSKRVSGTEEPGRDGDVSEAPERRDESDTSARTSRNRTPDHKRAASAVTPGYIITDPAEIGAGGVKTKFRQNVEAIKLLRLIESEGRLATRQATPEEQQILARYIGWGGMKGAFNHYAEDAGQWTKERDELLDLVTQGVISEDEYRTAERSTQYAHYTDGRIVQSMWQMVERLGFQKGRVLEPAAGIGNFFGLMPPDMRGNSKLVAVEMDRISGAITSLLYPSAGVEIKSFQDAAYPDDFFDLNISNYPFSETLVKSDPRYKNLQPNLHDYFLLKSLDKTKPGGLIVTVTSTGTMDKQENQVRKAAAKQADLIAAIRLPGKTHKGAETDVVTDILILRKRKPGEKPNGIQWTGTKEVSDPLGGQAIPVNEYFADSQTQILGRLDRSGTMYREGSKNVTRQPDFEKALAEAIDRLPQVFNADERSEGRTEPEVLPAPGDVKENAYSFKGDKLYRREGNQLLEIQPPNKTAFQRVVGMIGVRDSLRELLKAEDEDAARLEVARLRGALNSAYDAFTKRFGNLHDRANLQAYWDDPDSPILLALENIDSETGKITKSDIFRKSVTRRMVKAETAETVADALAITLNERGYLDVKRMAALLAKSEEEMGEQLVSQNLAFKDPIKGWELADLYLSGNVKRKLAEATAAASVDKAFEPNVEALKTVQPPDVPYSQINVRLGAPWVPAEDVQDFAAYLLQGQAQDFRVQYVSATGGWHVDYTKRGEALHREKDGATKIYGTARVNFIDVLQSALSGRMIVVKDLVSRNPDVWQVNAEESAKANEKLDGVKTKFVEWLWADDERQSRLHRLYNDQFNNIRLADYNGQHLTLPGINETVSLNPHHKDAVWEFLTQGRILLAHEVGVGKSFTETIALIEAKRLGLANKPLLVVPKANIHQITETAKLLYPTMRILSTARNFDAEKRQRVISRIATNDWDLVIMTHEHAGVIPVSRDVERSFIQQQIDELEDAIRGSQLIDPSKGNRVVRELNRKKEALEERLLGVLADKKRDDAVTWEQLGVDMLFVDEAHVFKSLPVYTSRNRVKGIPQENSQRALDLLMKIRWIQEKNGGKGVGFATGTPISNTMVELFNMQKYLQPDDMKERGVYAFDAWANTFGDTVTKFEYKATGDYEPVERFAEYNNLPELLKLARSMMDVRFADDMPWIKRPKRADTIVDAEMSAAQRRYLQIIRYRADIVKARKGPPQKGEDNMLSISTDARKMSLDMRLVDPRAKDDPESKLNKAVGNVLDIYRERPDKTQLIFSNLGTSDTAWGFNLYEDIISKLVAGGIPRDQIINFSALTEVQKRSAADKIYSGKAKIGLGSTEVMGQGLNMQKHLYALHHLDAPWRPSDIEQREGRAYRQGNLNPDIAILRYVVKESFDTFMWQTLDTKARFIKQAMKADLDVRQMVEDDDGEISYAQVFAITSGNPHLIRKIELEHALNELEAGERRHSDEQFELRGSVKRTETRIKNSQQQIADFKDDADHAEAVKDEKFSLTLLGKTYDKRDEADAALNQLANDLLLDWDAYQQDKTGKKKTDFKKLAWLEKNPKVGEYRGFTITATASWGISFGVQRKQGYGIKSSTASIDGVLRNIHTHAEREATQLDSLEKNLARAKEEIGKSFAKTDELRKARAEYEEVSEKAAEAAEAQKSDTQVLQNGSDFLYGEPPVTLQAFIAEQMKEVAAEYDRSDESEQDDLQYVKKGLKSEWEGEGKSKREFLDKYLSSHDTWLNRQYMQGPAKDFVYTVELYDYENVTARHAESGLIKTWPGLEAFEDETGHILFTKYSGPPKGAKVIDGVIYLPGVTAMQARRATKGDLPGPWGKVEIEGKKYYTDGKILLRGTSPAGPVAARQPDAATFAAFWATTEGGNVVTPVAQAKQKGADLVVWFDNTFGFRADQYDHVVGRFPNATFRYVEEKHAFVVYDKGKRVGIVSRMAATAPEAVESVIDQLNEKRKPKEGDVLSDDEPYADLAPVERAKKIAAGLRESKTGLKHILGIPIGEQAEYTKGVVREFNAEAELRYDQAEQALKTAIRFAGRQKAASNLQALDLWEAQQPMPGQYAPFQAYFDTAHDLADQRVQVIKSLGKGQLQSFIETYLGRMYKNPPGKAVEFKIVEKQQAEGRGEFYQSPTTGAVIFVEERPSGLAVGATISTPSVASGGPLNITEIKKGHVIAEDSAGNYHRIVKGSKAYREIIGAPGKGYIASTPGRYRGYDLDAKGLSKFQQVTPKKAKKGWSLANDASGLFSQALAKRPLQGPQSFRKERTFEFHQDAREAGYIPLTDNPFEWQLLKLKEMDRFIFWHKTLGDLKDKKIVIFVRRGQKAPEGFGKIDSAATKVFYKDAAGHMVESGEYYAPKEVAQIINNFASPGLGKYALFRGWRAVGNAMNAAQLGLSAFHAGKVVYESYGNALNEVAYNVMSAMAKAGTRQSLSHLVAAGKAALETIPAPAIDIYRGIKIKRAALIGHGLTPEVARWIDAEVAGGVRFKTDKHYMTNARKTIARAWREGNYLALGNPFRLFLAALETAAWPLMEKVIPWLKLGAKTRVAMRELQINPNMGRADLRRVMGEADDHIDNMLGQMTYDNVFMNHLVKDVAMASLRSLGWEGGTWRDVLGGLADYGKAAKTLAGGSGGGSLGGGGGGIGAGSAGPARGGGSHRPRVTRRMANLITMPAFALLVGSVLTYLLTGKKPKDFWHAFFIDSGVKDKDGKPVYIESPTYIYGIKSWLSEPGRTFTKKENPAVSTVVDMLQNEDFYGQEIFEKPEYGDNDSWLKQRISDVKAYTWQGGKFIGKQFIPIGITNTKKALEDAEKATGSGAGRWLSTWGATVGFRHAPKSESATALESYMNEIAAKHRSGGARTAAEVEKTKLHRDLLDEMRVYEDDRQYPESLKQRLEALPKQEATLLRKQARETPEQSRFGQLSAVEAIRAWKLATPEEKQALADTILTKIDRAKHDDTLPAAMLDNAEKISSEAKGLSKRGQSPARPL